MRSASAPIRAQSGCGYVSNSPMISAASTASVYVVLAYMTITTVYRMMVV